MAEMELQEDAAFRADAEEAARIGGRVLAEWAEKFTVREKSRANLVTEADLASEKAIFGFLRGKHPEHHFLGEEGLDQTPGESRYRWVIDPLDGTSNYVHGFPYYCVSVALECDGELLAGAIYDPNRDEMFSASAGAGATVNGRKLEPTETDSLSEALVVASLPVGVGADHPAVATFLRVLPKAQHLQRTGSAALNLCYVAAGRIDAYWSSSLRPWDVAAGAIIVAEAGGRVSRADEGPLDIEVPDLVASNGTRLHRELCALLEGQVE